MGGYGPPLPGRGFPRQGPQGGVYGQPNDLVSSRTPVANKLVDGIWAFRDGFKGVQEEEKTKARQEFLEGVQMLQLGLPQDMKKLARAARAAGFNFDYDGPTKAEQQAEQAPPPMPGGGGMPGGAPMGGMPQGGAPMPGGGGKGFFGRLGQALTPQSFQAQPPIPGNAGVYEALEKIKQRGLGGDLESENKMEQAKLLKTVLTGDDKSPEWAAALKRLQAAAGKLPEGLDTESIVQNIVNSSGGKITEEQARRKVYAYQNFDPEKNMRLAATLISAGATPESATKFVEDGATGNPLDGSILKMVDKDAESLGDDIEKRYESYWLPEYPGQPQVAKRLATLEALPDKAMLAEALRDPALPKGKSAIAADRAAEDQEMQKRNLELSEAAAARAAKAEETGEGKRKQKEDIDRIANVVWAEAHRRIKKDIQAPSSANDILKEAERLVRTGSYSQTGVPVGTLEHALRVMAGSGGLVLDKQAGPTEIEN